MKKISCIIPVYNSEKTIIKCLDSIFSQTNEIEVVVVNDGSKDNSDEVIKEYMKKNPSYDLNYIVQENGGVSNARNHGLSKASGEYITFIDSDDYVLEGYFESLKENFEKYELSVFSYVTNSKYVNSDILDNMVGEYDSKEFLQLLINVSKVSILGYIWRCLFKRSIIEENNIRFHEGIKMSEDYLFLCQYVNSVKGKINVSNKELYYYWISEGSTTGKYISTLKENMEYVNKVIYDQIVSKNSNLENNYCDCVSNTFLQITQNVMRKNSPLTMSKGYKYLKGIKKEYDKYLSLTYKRKKTLRKNLSNFVLFYKFRLLWLYMVLYKVKLKLKY